MPPEANARPIVLAVDDAAESLSLLTDILEDAGITTLVAQSGRSALALLQHVTPDGILMDAVMPEMNGFETCEAIKAKSEFAHIPLIFMTGLTETEHIVRGFASGGVDYITKPVNPEELTARVLAHLANARMAQAARMALDVAGTPLIALAVDGDVQWITPQATKLFRKSMPGDDVFSDLFRARLAPALQQVIANKATRAELSDGLKVPMLATYIGETGTGEHLIRLSDAGAPDRDAENNLARLREVFELTRRESEVLLWITQGKTNRDVAQILSCSPRTVNKHLEQIYAKLNVENRTAAAMQAVRVLMDD